jgi:hypothetical protein
LLSFKKGFIFDLFGLHIALPLWTKRWHKEPEDMMSRWGWYYHYSDLCFEWGQWHKRFHMPWNYTHIISQVRRPDGSFVKENRTYSRPDDIFGFHDWDDDGRWVGHFVYRYTLQSGEIQTRTATVTVGRQEWRQRWLKWTRLFAKVRTSIDVRFDAEVGERTGSWKGGVLGTGYTMLPGETAEQTLRRMEAEHKM